ncbi:hypothetical protein Tsubulata_045285 [Turnera subulata]|uniref:Uncharacterized protein n=1 Tax=Turnera subulata TaxID=218843 RepID=A0A9Q0FKH7_9ROSI|nr:hypothetical protein Tsubulata_045285 [Turnera subulata]
MSSHSSSSSSIKSVPRHPKQQSAKRITSVGKQKPDFGYVGVDILCFCGLRSGRWISWTDDHPGVRFHKCNVCKFFRFIDAIEGWAAEVIRGLRDRERELHVANQELETELHEHMINGEALIGRVDELESENGELKAEIGELKAENGELKAQNLRLAEERDALSLESRKLQAQIAMYEREKKNFRCKIGAVVVAICIVWLFFRCMLD